MPTVEPDPTVRPWSSTTNEDAELHLRATVQVAGGIPASNVHARLLSALRSPDEVYSRHALDVDAVGVPVGELGAIDARLRVPFGGTRVLEVGADDGATRWIWLEDARSALDLGTIEVAHAGALDVLVLDESGALAGSTASVSTVGDFLRGPDGTFVFARAARAPCEAGRAVLRGLPAGEVELEARSQRGIPIARAKAVVRAGATVAVTLGPNGFSTGRRLLVDVVLPADSQRDAWPDSIVLTASDGSQRTARVICLGGGASWTLLYAFHGLDDGEHELTIRAPGFVPWRRSGLRPGERVRAELRGPSAIRVSLVERDGSTIVTGLPARLEFARKHDGVFVFHRSVTTTEAESTVEGLLPGSYSIVARHPLHELGTGLVAELADGETRDVRIKLDPGRQLHGRIVNADGAPRSYADQLDVLALTLEQWKEWWRGGVIDRAQRAEMESEGHFSFSQLTAGARGVLVEVGPWYSCAFELHDGEGLLESAPRVFQLPVLTSLGGRIPSALGVHLGSASLYLQPLRHEGEVGESAEFDELRLPMEPAHARITDPRKATRIEHDGSFLVNSVPLGEYALWLSLPLSELDDRDLGAKGALNALRIGRAVVDDPRGFFDVFELGHDSPGAVRVRWKSDDARPMHVEFLDGAGHICTRAAVIPDGRPLYVALFPGTYTVRLVSDNSGWSHTLGRELEIPTGKVVDLEPRLAVSEGLVEFLDSVDSSPMAGADFALCTRGEPAILEREAIEFRTNAEGRSRFTLLSGVYSVFGPGAKSAREPRAIAKFEWPPIGSKPLVVRVRR